MNTARTTVKNVIQNKKSEMNRISLLRIVRKDRTVRFNYVDLHKK